MIKVEHLNKSFEGVPVLKDISVEQLRSTCSYAVGLEARVLSKLRIDVRYNGQFKKKTTAIGKVDVNTFALNLGYYF